MSSLSPGNAGEADAAGDGGPPAAGDGALEGDGSGSSETSVMSGCSGRDRSTCPASESTVRSSTRSCTRLVAGKFATIVFTSE